MTEIKRDIVTAKPSQSVKQELDSSKIVSTNYRAEYRRRILDVLRASNRALNLTEISRATKINYFTVRSTMLELLVAGKVERFKSGQYWFYQIAK